MQSGPYCLFAWWEQSSLLYHVKRIMFEFRQLPRGKLDTFSDVKGFFPKKKIVWSSTRLLLNVLSLLLLLLPNIKKAYIH